MRKKLPILNPDPAETEPTDGVLATGKLELLRRGLGPRVREGVLVAFSGGMDSAFLLWAASEEQRVGGGRVVALTTTSPSMPSYDRDDAMAFSRNLGVEHIWKESREVTLPQYARNDRDRCYHCKTELFRIAGELAEQTGLRWLLYGYNASDHDDDRPGQRAAAERGVLAPLSEAGLNKAEIRFLMREAGLPLADKPPSPCLSSRIMTGVEVTPERLRHIEEMEGILRRAGVATLRVRVCGAEDGTHFLRVEVAPEEMEAVLGCGEELQRAGVGMGYRWVTLDLGGYRTGGGVL